MLTYHFISPSNPVNPEISLILGCKDKRNIWYHQIFCRKFLFLIENSVKNVNFAEELSKTWYGAGPALSRKREAFSKLFFYPSHQYRYRILLLFFCQLSSGRYMMPFEEASTTAAACSMLGYKYRMTLTNLQLNLIILQRLLKRLLISSSYNN